MRECYPLNSLNSLAPLFNTFYLYFFSFSSSLNGRLHGPINRLNAGHPYIKKESDLTSTDHAQGTLSWPFPVGPLFCPISASSFPLISPSGLAGCFYFPGGSALVCLAFVFITLSISSLHVAAVSQAPPSAYTGGPTPSAMSFHVEVLYNSYPGDDTGTHTFTRLLYT